jgi:hypothetical protein
MKSKRLRNQTKEKFLPPRITQMVGVELEDSLLNSSKDVPMTILDTGHEVETYSSDSYWE